MNTPTARAAPHTVPLPLGEGRGEGAAHAEKSALRTQALARRHDQNPAAGHRLAGHVLTRLAPPPGAIIAGTWPLGTEIDVRPLLLALLARGHIIVLPETPPRGTPLIFRRWRPNTPMLPERFGTSRPDAPILAPDLLLVPLLAFDASGHRLGYGGGYYDRTLAAHPQLRTIGCAYASQQVDAVPVLPHDAPLDAIATEHGVIIPEP